MPEISPETLLETCPRCDYSLHTLPVECRCPECGSLLDRRWQIIVPIRASKAALGWRVLTSLLCAGLTFRFALRVFSEWGKQSRWVLLPAALWLGAAPVMCYMAWRCLFARPPGFMAINPQGLVVSHAPEGHQLYAWSRIKAVAPSSWTMGVILKLDGDKVRLSSRTFFRGSEERSKCLEMIGKYRRSLAKDEQTS